VDGLNKLPLYLSAQFVRAYMFRLYKTALYLILCACAMSVLHPDHVASRQSAPGNNPQGRRSSGIVSLAHLVQKKKKNFFLLLGEFVQS
jgi:hypothetical protein